MIVLGIGTIYHDPAACIIVDGKLVAAAEEERFIRQKHASGKFPVNAIKFCLKEAGLKPSDIRVVAHPWSPEVYDKYKWKFFRRAFWNRPAQAVKAIRKARQNKRSIIETPRNSLRAAGIDPDKVKIHYIEHHVAHGASAFLFSGFPNAAIMSIDGSGEFPATMIGYTMGDKIEIIKEFCYPDSLGYFYSTMTDYLGFRRMNGEYKLMGMAPFGDPSKYDFGDIIRYRNKSYKVSDDYVAAVRRKRFDKDKWYSKAMVKRFGPTRTGDGLREPYIHVAAATQARLEEISIKLMEDYLSDVLPKVGGRLCFSGGCALNVKLNLKLIEHPLVKELWVQPASTDAGAPLGAAALVAHKAGDKIEPMRNAYYGPEYHDEDILAVFSGTQHKITKPESIVDKTCELISEGKVVAWFQGKMEWGPRALGNRSILGNPTVTGTADKINEIIKFREKWRPFCPSMLAEQASEVFETSHDSPFMTFCFKVKDEWKKRIPEVVHVDNTARPQFVSRDQNPKFYGLLRNYYEKTGVPILINTSLNRRGEPMVCSPEDALRMFEGSGLEYLAIGDFLVEKKK